MLPTIFTLTSLFVFAHLGYARQCRLVLNNNDLALGTPGGAIGGPTPTSSSNGSVPSSSASAIPTLAAFNYGHDTIRGVNLGGWLVLEPWITPSLFQNTNDTSIIDEFTLGQKLDNNTALSIMQNHWQTWITEDDFKAIKAAGLNHVRIPLGYWSVPMTSADTNFTTSVAPYIPGAWPYFVQGLNWAKQYGLHTIVDLHGAPGSQNGFDNSGQRTGNPTWGNDQNSVQRTLDIIRVITKKVGGMIDVLQPLNEPAAYRPAINSILRDFWTNSYQAVRQIGGNSPVVMIHDGFLGVGSWQNFLTYPSAQGVIMDIHAYQIFNFDQLELSFAGHLNYSCQVKDQLVSFDRSNIFTIIGEWSTAPTDCAKWLNGRGVGARWDGTWQPGNPTLGSCTGLTGDFSTFSDDYKVFLRKYWESQVDIGEAIQGWVYWTWKVEDADDWSYQRGLQGGWIPQDPTERMYPNVCN